MGGGETRREGLVNTALQSRVFFRRRAGQLTEEGEGGFACAVQPHREVRPESGLVGIAEHIVINKR